MPGNWTTVVVAAEVFLGSSWPPTGLDPLVDVLVYGEAKSLRPAFLKGALDFLRTPWDGQELLLRAARRRGQVYRWESLEAVFTLNGTRLSSGDDAVNLTHFEVAVLGFLVARQGRTVSRQSLEAQLYGPGERPRSHVLTTIVSRLRSSLTTVGQLGSSNPLVSERGRGYRLP
jgi:DNA-binding response OmpR family regulator